MRCQTCEELLETGILPSYLFSGPFSLPLPAWSKRQSRLYLALGTELGDGKDKEIYNAYSVPSSHLQYGGRQKTNSCNKNIKVRLYERAGGATQITPSLEV